MTKSLIAHPLMDLSPFLGGGEGPEAVGIGHDGAVYACKGVTSAALRTTGRGGASFPKSQLSQGTSYTVSRWLDGEVKTITVDSEPIVVSSVQPSPRGLLLVGARCRWSANGPERNAVEIDWDGRELQRLTLGDGINGIQTTPSGAVWASYFDEGVFGNYGWGGPGPAPVGASGLVRFDAAGNEAFAYEPEVAGTDSICDAYAVNVVDDHEAWVYFYTEFPIVRILRDTYKAWQFGESGAHAMAVDGSRVLLYGDYKRRNRLRLVELGSNGTATVTADFVPTRPNGEPIEEAYGVGIGKNLYLVRQREVFLLNDW